MKGVIISSTVQNDGGKERKISKVLVNYFLKPVRSGLFGFSAFFTVLLISKYLGFLIGSLQSFVVDIEDVTLSLLGFFLVFLIKFLENFKDRTVD